MTRRQVIARTLVAAALALGFFVDQAAPARADEVDLSPFRTLSCSCHETAPAGSTSLMDEIHRGMREGHSAWLAALPAPTG